MSDRPEGQVLEPGMGGRREEFIFEHVWSDYSGRTSAVVGFRRVQRRPKTGEAVAEADAGMNALKTFGVIQTVNSAKRITYSCSTLLG
jgi:hypothetical protein